MTRPPPHAARNDRSFLPACTPTVVARRRQETCRRPRTDDRGWRGDPRQPAKRPRGCSSGGAPEAIPCITSAELRYLAIVVA